MIDDARLDAAVEDNSRHYYYYGYCLEPCRHPRCVRASEGDEAQAAQDAADYDGWLASQQERTT